ncbi:hypothetical protein [Pseudomonas fluorescens]|uniref:Peptidase M41 domain-containing protein n=1 Tax=Pseudomonas fluorescens TaxID=294 RepID=A0A5E7EBN1_PSEFL|nr:hypothetical protein [Pseudomonas fluorescens]VVO24190.1 hypothetical protein PS691_04423 [Pseudomonas fluorescens]
MNKRLRRTAVHEAGHALAFWWNGQHIERVTVRTRTEASIGPMIDLRGNRQNVEGLVEADYCVPHPSSNAPGIAEYLPSMLESIERDLLHCFAGPVAEAVYRHTRSDRFIKGSGLGDLRRGYALISLLPARKLLDAESRAIARSSCLVRRYWPAVSAVADLLQEHGTVDGEAITALLWEVTGESPTLRNNDLTTLDTRWNKP